ncbi:MAG: ABC transporter ATP-binding protein/permease [Defluviitaleaceae bacterium]|nr:ABC transporter ATP-binding protein/permease [Defluviitaleaceae bacterium]
MKNLLFEFFFKNKKLTILYNINHFVSTAISFMIIFIAMYTINLNLSFNNTIFVILSILTIKIISDFVLTYTENFSQTKIQEERFNKYLKINKLALKSPFEKYDDKNFVSTLRAVSRFFGSNISGFEAVLQNVFKLPSIILITFLSAIFVFYINFYILIITLALGFVRYKASQKINNFDIDNFLENGHMNNKLSFYRELSLDHRAGKDIRIFNMENLILSKYKELGNDVKNLLSKKIKINNLWSIVFVFSNFISELAFYSIIFYMAFNNYLSTANFFLLLGVYQIFSINYILIIELLSNTKKEMVLYKHYNDFLKETVENKDIESGTYDEKEENEIKLTNVSFKYPKTEKYVLKNINMKFGINEKIALIGENGSGKTTLIKLLLNLYKPTDGEISTSSFAVVFQNSDLISGTLFENVFLTNEPTKKDVEKLKYYFKKFDLSKYFVENENIKNVNLLKELYEDGFVPSGGVKQKLLIIRALLQNKKFIILDEPSSSLDIQSEEIFYKELFSEKDKGFLIISHKESLLNTNMKKFKIEKGIATEWN